jgi:hypothetical protein
VSPKPLPLWRFFVVAALIVVAVGSVVFARRGGPPDLQISGKVSGTPTPTAQRPAAAPSPGPQAAFRGSGAWVMSSLPSCFRERERRRGSVAELRATFPPTSERIRPPAVVMSGDCRLGVRDRELWISRGDDRLRVPPTAFLYREAGGFTLVSIHGTQAEIRRYESGLGAAATP